MSNHFDGSASTPEGGLVISSPYGSPMAASVGGGRGGGTDQVPRLGTSEDEEYFEYLFELTPVSGDDESDRCTYVPVSIEVTGDEQYFSMWLCDSFTERISVRDPSANFKPGETVTATNGATAVVKDWHRFRENGALHIIEFVEGSASGNFPGYDVTGSSSNATAECIAGWQDTDETLSYGIDPVTQLPAINQGAQPVIRASLSGFYAYPKEVCYTKWLAPKCDTLVDICGDIAEYPDQTAGWDDMFGPSSPGRNCEMSDFLGLVPQAHSEVWGQKEFTCSRESTRPNAVETGVYKAEPLLGREQTLDKQQTGDPIPFTNKTNINLENQIKAATKEYFDDLLCDFTFGSPENMEKLTNAISAPANVQENYSTIIDTAKSTEEIADKKIEPEYRESSDMFKKMRTTFCEVAGAIDYAIAANDFTDQLMSDTATYVPSNVYIEIQQEWCTHSFRSVPPPGEKLKWSVFNYDPHKNGEKILNYTIVGKWVCTRQYYMGDVTTTDPNTGEQTTTQQQLANPGFGQLLTKVFTTSNTIEANWSTHRDNLEDVVERQGGDGTVKVAQIKDFINPSDDEFVVFDYDAKELPSYGYMEFNNYDIQGRGIQQMEPINIGNGYMNAPTITFNEPDLEGGSLPVVTANVSNGRISGYNIVNPGSGYVQEPIVTVSPPDPEIYGVGDLNAGSQFVFNVDMDDYDKLFLGLRVTSSSGTMTQNEILRVVPGVAMTVTADGSVTVSVDSVEFSDPLFELEDVTAGMLIEGFDDPTVSVAAIDILANEITMSQAIPAGTYEINTKRAFLLIQPSDLTFSGADLVFTAPSVVNATARARLFVGKSGGSAYVYKKSREIAHYDGVRHNGDGSVTLLNTVRGKKETEIAQHLRNDHTFQHEFV
tara:strand:- start:832 stop:3486 length:2655 start_codon:yes stop_codon:yes gene_type:complete